MGLLYRWGVERSCGAWPVSSIFGIRIQFWKPQVRSWRYSTLVVGVFTPGKHSLASKIRTEGKNNRGLLKEEILPWSIDYLINLIYTFISNFRSVEWVSSSQTWLQITPWTIASHFGVSPVTPYSTSKGSLEIHRVQNGICNHPYSRIFWWDLDRQKERKKELPNHEEISNSLKMTNRQFLKMMRKWGLWT